MSIICVSRHNGSVEWLTQDQNLKPDRVVVHLDLNEIAPGDTVIGNLPLRFIAEICARGARFLNMSIDQRVEDRSRDLTLEEVRARNPSVEEYRVTRVG